MFIHTINRLKWMRPLNFVRSRRLVFLSHWWFLSLAQWLSMLVINIEREMFFNLQTTYIKPACVILSLNRGTLSRGTESAQSWAINYPHIENSHSRCSARQGCMNNFGFQDCFVQTRTTARLSWQRIPRYDCLKSNTRKHFSPEVSVQGSLNIIWAYSL